METVGGCDVWYTAVVVFQSQMEKGERKSVDARVSIAERLQHCCRQAPNISKTIVITIPNINILRTLYFSISIASFFGSFVTLNFSKNCALFQQESCPRGKIPRHEISAVLTNKPFFQSNLNPCSPYAAHASSRMADVGRSDGVCFSTTSVDSWWRDILINFVTQHELSQTFVTQLSVWLQIYRLSMMNAANGAFLTLIVFFISIFMH